MSVTVNEAAKSAFVIVPDHQLSLAIGKEGQNVRLAARLTQWRIDIRSETQAKEQQRDQFGKRLARLESPAAPSAPGWIASRSSSPQVYPNKALRHVMVWRQNKQRGR